MKTNQVWERASRQADSQSLPAEDLEVKFNLLTGLVELEYDGDVTHLTRTEARELLQKLENFRTWLNE